MHELSITQAILDLALEEARKANAEKIVKIDLVVGELTGIEPEYVRFYHSVGAVCPYRPLNNSSSCAS